MGQTQQQELALASVEGGHGGPDCSQHLVFFFFPTGTLTSMTTLRFMVGSSGLLPVYEQAAAVVQVLNP